MKRISHQGVVGYFGLLKQVGFFVLAIALAAGMNFGNESARALAGRDEAEDDEEEQQEELREEYEDDGTSGSNSTRVNIQGSGDVRTRINIESNVGSGSESQQTQLRVEGEGEGFQVHVEDNQAEGGENAPPTVIDEFVAGNKIRVLLTDNQAIIEGTDTKTVTDLPVTVDQQTNILTVNTPNGEEHVTMLPDQAVQSVLTAHLATDADRHGIRLVLRDDALVYEIPGTKQQRLLGFLPVTTKVTVIVSAQTGETVDTQQSSINRLITLFSSPV